MNSLRTFVRAVRRIAPARWIANATETVIFGSRLRERAAQMILNGYYSSDFRRQWIWQINGEPHFMRHSGLLCELLTGDVGKGVYSLNRAFLTADVIREGDEVLDIGCGDGSYTKRFYAPNAKHVDAIDIEKNAIRYAAKRNSAPNITYAVLDAVKMPFPRSSYDVIVFDGALGHFSRDGSIEVLTKIGAALKPDGIFCGSESIGRQGHDHLQFFDSARDLHGLLSETFSDVRVIERTYSLPGMRRTEGYWRCGHSEKRLRALEWH